MSLDLNSLKSLNATRWLTMKINDSANAQVTAVANRLTASGAQARYKMVSAKTGVPANVIAVIHEREASQRWDTQLGQGDPLNRVSTHVPKGRGPFSTWEDGAYDALVNCAPYAARNKDWSAGGTLTLLEQYNGLGYARMGRPSPYIWAATNQYVSGKYVADGVYDPNAVDKQIGCAALLKRMGALAVPLPPPKPPVIQSKHVAGFSAITAAIAAAMTAHSTEVMAAIIIGGIAVAVLLHIFWPKKQGGSQWSSSDTSSSGSSSPSSVSPPTLSGTPTSDTAPLQKAPSTSESGQPPEAPAPSSSKAP